MSRPCSAFADAQDGVKRGAVGVHGYCMSGPYALAAAARYPDRVAAAASFYGTWLVSDAVESPHLSLGKIKGEVHIACAEIDELAPLPMVEELRPCSRRPAAPASSRSIRRSITASPSRSARSTTRPAAERHWERLIALYRRRLGLRRTRHADALFRPGLQLDGAAHRAARDRRCRSRAARSRSPRRSTTTPAYLAINPEGKVPTLLIDGRPLTEVAGILFYLARRFPEAGLLPQGDAEAEAQAISWMSFIAATVHPARARGVEHAMAIFGTRRSAAGPARLGGRRRYSIADIHLFRLYWRFANAAQADRAAFPNLEAHYDRMMARPAVRRTIEIEKGDRLRAAVSPGRPLHDLTAIAAA